MRPRETGFSGIIIEENAEKTMFGKRKNVLKRPNSGKICNFSGKMRKTSSKCLTETGKAVYGNNAGKKEGIFLKIPLPLGNLNSGHVARILR